MTSAANRETLEVLRRARELLTPPGNWTQEEFAKTTAGEPCDPCVVEAACWCSEGAIRAVRARGRFGPTNAFGALYRIVGDVVGWNDEPERTQAEVLEAFDRAIALAQGDGDGR